jgi:hypothetical protein
MTPEELQRFNSLEQQVSRLSDVYYRTHFVDKDVFSNPVYFNGRTFFKHVIDVMTYASTITLDITKGFLHSTTTVHATGNATINASGTGKAGNEIVVLITNDATSGKVITFGTNFLPVGTLTGTTSKSATIGFISNGVAWYEKYRTLVL